MQNKVDGLNEKGLEIVGLANCWVEVSSNWYNRSTILEISEALE